MIHKVLMAARRVAGRNSRHAVSILQPLDQHPELEDQPATLELINTDVEAFDELVALVIDYFAAGRSPTHCRYCGAPIEWVRTTSGAKAPLDACTIDGIDADGVHHRIRLNHFTTCPEAETVREQQRLKLQGNDDGKSRAGR